MTWRRQSQLRQVKLLGQRRASDPARTILSASHSPSIRTLMCEYAPHPDSLHKSPREKISQDKSARATPPSKLLANAPYSHYSTPSAHTAPAPAGFLLPRPLQDTIQAEEEARKEVSFNIRDIVGSSADISPSAAAPRKMFTRLQSYAHACGREETEFLADLMR